MGGLVDDVSRFQERSTLGKAWSLFKIASRLTVKSFWIGGVTTLLDTALSYLAYGGLVWYGACAWCAWRALANRRSAPFFFGFIALAAIAYGIGHLHVTGQVDFAAWLKRHIAEWAPDSADASGA